MADCKHAKPYGFKKLSRLHPDSLEIFARGLINLERTVGIILVIIYLRRLHLWQVKDPLGCVFLSKREAAVKAIPNSISFT